MRTPVLVPEDRNGGATITPLVRACIAVGLAALNRRTGSAADFARQRFGDDRLAGLVLRAATSPASLVGNPDLARVAVAYLAALTPVSAGADLLARGIGLNFDGAASILVPAIAIPTAGFVGEGAPIPVTMAPTSAGPVLTPYKLAVISSLTREMMESSNAETLIARVLIESTGPALDAVLFSANAAASDRPAGLLHGIAALTPATGTEKASIIVDDLAQLALAIASVSGNGDVVVVASIDTAVALRLRLPQAIEWPVLQSASLPAKTVIAVAAAAVVSALGGPPEISASAVAEFHRETAPAPIVTTTGTVATPVGSLYQTDEIGLKLRWPISWALRSSAGLAWMQNVNW